MDVEILNIFLCILNINYYLDPWTLTMAGVGKVFLKWSSHWAGSCIGNKCITLTDRLKSFLCMNSQSRDDLYRILHFRMYTGIYSTNCILKKGGLPHSTVVCPTAVASHSMRRHKCLDLYAEYCMDTCKVKSVPPKACSIKKLWRKVLERRIYNLNIFS